MVNEVRSHSTSLSHRKYADEPLQLDGEIWKEIPDWPGYYVSSLGRIRDEVGIRRLTQSKTRHRSSVLRIGDRVWKATVAAYMLHTFVGPAPEGKTLARHLDDVATNDTVTNLAWGSKKDNYLDALRNGRVNHQALGPLISAAKKGKPTRLSYEQMSRGGRKGVATVNSVRVHCPHCGLEGLRGPLKRWHFDRCPKRVFGGPSA